MTSRRPGVLRRQAGARGDSPRGHYLDITLGSGGQVLAYAKPNHQPARAAGVQIEHYELPDFRTDPKGIARNESGRRIAWFTDPAGNILAVQESV